MKLKTILVDDEPRGLTSLETLLQLNCPDVDVVAACTDADAAIDKINALHPQLVFLDIAMPGKNGFDLLHELGSPHFEVIFITAHNQYTIEAFHFSAIDYLLKPVDDDLLKDAVSRATKRIAEKSGRDHIETLIYNLQQRQASGQMKLCLPSVKGFQVVELNDIVYAESSGNYTNFHFKGRPLVCTSKPIADYEDLLSDSGFVRIHKSILVNLLHVTEYIKGEGGFVIMDSGEKLEVSRRKKENFIAKMKTYYKY